VAQLGIQLTEQQANDAEGGAFVVVPRDRYLLQITEGDVKRNKKNSGDLYEYKVEVIEGDFAGAKWIGNINVTHTSAVAQRIGQGQLSALALAQGQDPTLVNDTEQYNDLPFMADVDIETYTANNGQERERNTIKKFIHAGNADSAPIGKDDPKPANDNVKPATTASNSNNRPPANAAGAATASGGGAARSMPWKK
jgi:hypothetical protein